MHVRVMLGYDAVRIVEKVHGDSALPIKTASPGYIWYLQMVAAVVIIQRVWRGHVGRRRFISMVEGLVFGSVTDLSEASLEEYGYGSARSVCRHNGFPDVVLAAFVARAGCCHPALSLGEAVGRAWGAPPGAWTRHAASQARVLPSVPTAEASAMAVAPVAACLGVTLRAARRAETSHPVPCTREVALRPLRPPSSRQQPLRMAAASEAVAARAKGMGRDAVAAARRGFAPWMAWRRRVTHRGHLATRAGPPQVATPVVCVHPLYRSHRHSTGTGPRHRLRRRLHHCREVTPRGHREQGRWCVGRSCMWAAE